MRTGVKTRFLLLAALIAATAVRVAAADGRARVRAGAEEHAIKAALLLNFARFVEWPPDREQPGRPLVLAVTGDGSVADALKDAARGVVVRGRPVVVVSPATDRQADDADLVFVPEDAGRPSAARLQSLAAHHVLAVGEAPGFLEEGGSLRLVVQDERVRFHAASGVAARTGLRVSSALLDLAVIVAVEAPLRHDEPARPSTRESAP